MQFIDFAIVLVVISRKEKFMAKTIILFSALFFVTYISFGQKKMNADEASKHYGETVTICDKIYGIEFSESTKSFTAIKVGDVSKKSKMFVFLTPEMLQKLTDNGKTSITNKSVCVTGKVRFLKGMPEIVVNNPNEIYLINEGGGMEIRPNDFMRFE